jgi:hypothetical protein
MDHVVVGPAGVYAFETKVRSKPGRLKGKGAYEVQHDGRVLHFADRGGRPHTDFVRQAESGAKWLSRWLASATGDQVPVLASLGAAVRDLNVSQPLIFYASTRTHRASR